MNRYTESRSPDLLSIVCSWLGTQTDLLPLETLRTFIPLLWPIRLCTSLPFVFCVNLHGYLIRLSQNVPLNKPSIVKRYRHVQGCYFGSCFPCLQQESNEIKTYFIHLLIRFIKIHPCPWQKFCLVFNASILETKRLRLKGWIKYLRFWGVVTKKLVIWCCL